MSNSTETTGVFPASFHTTPVSSFNITSIISTASFSTTGIFFDNATTTDASMDIVSTEGTDTDTGENGVTPSGADYSYDYGDDYGNDYMYPGYMFERPIYMFVWEILVILTFLVNIVVIVVLLRRSMRTPTNMILVAIAISDSLTGLVTLPSYIMVYQRFDPCKSHDGSANYPITDNHTSYASDYEARLAEYGYDPGDLMGNDTTHENNGGGECTDAYVLTETLCRFFMISKFFVSKSFHTMSIWLTLYLGFQRYISVAFPFKSQNMFTIQKTVITCTVIFILAPILHVYHLVHEKAADSMCQWVLEENCEGGCAHLWISFLFRHLIPCVLLVVFTVLFIIELIKSANKTKAMQSNANQASIRKRSEDNRRISIIVTAIVIVFLIPEIPYGVFLLVSAIKHLEKIPSDLEGNRAIHAAYEISLVLSFQANFFIYTLFNKRFRKGLKRTFKSLMQPIFGVIGKGKRGSVSRSTSFNTATYGRTATSDFLSKTAIPLDDMSKSASLTRSTDMPPGSIHEEERAKFIESNTFKDEKL